MNVADYLLGDLALSVTLLPWVPASVRLSRRLLPGSDAAVAALSSSVIGIGGVIVVAELVGACDGFRRWPLAIVSALVAALVAKLGRPGDGLRRRAAGLPAGRAARAMLACTAVCILATTAALIGRDASVLTTGPHDLDSLHYHLTQAAQIVESHNIDRIHHTASSDGTAYYPYDAELLDAVGMLGPRPDIAVFGLNLLFGWLALLACWVIGACWSRGAPALAAGSAVLALPIVSRASSGPGLNDIPTMAFLLSAVAMVAVAGLPRGDKPRNRWLTELSLAGAALGLAAGTKLNALPVVVLLALAVVVMASKSRWAAFAALAGPAVVTGGFWYVRDWITVGSPVPDLNLTVAGHGFHVVPYPEVQPFAYTVAHYLGDYSVIRHWFVPGLHAVWTGLWPLVGLLLVAGVVIAVVFDRSGLRRALGIVTAAGFLAYLVTPTTAIGVAGAPVLFATNTRYALPSIVVAIVLLASSPRLRRVAPIVTICFTVLTLVLLALSSLPQQIDYGEGTAVTVAIVLVGFGAREIVRRRRTAVAVGVLAAVVAVGVVGWGAVLQRNYLRDRYSSHGFQDRLFATVGAFQHVRIGVAGHGLQYPFYGRTFDNTVNYIGVSAPSHAFEGPSTCQALLGVLDRVHDDYVVLEPLPAAHTGRIAKWLSAIPGVQVVFRDYDGTVYRLPATIPADSCLYSS